MVKVIYDKRRKLVYSLAVKGGILGDRVIIGIKDKPSKRAILDTIKHESTHLETYKGFLTQGKGKPTHYIRAMRELKAYSLERKRSTPRQWNRVLSVRIKDFMNYISWLSKSEQKKIRPTTNRILSPKATGGNLVAIGSARDRLKGWWL